MKKFLALVVLALVLGALGATNVFAGGGGGQVVNTSCPARFAQVSGANVIRFAEDNMATQILTNWTGTGSVLNRTLNLDENQEYAKIQVLGVDDFWVRCDDAGMTISGQPAPQATAQASATPSGQGLAPQGVVGTVDYTQHGFVAAGICEFAQQDVIFSAPAPTVGAFSFYQPGTGSSQPRGNGYWMPVGGQPQASFGAYYRFSGPITIQCLASQMQFMSISQFVAMDGTVLLVKESGTDRILGSDNTVIFDPTP